VGKKVRRVDQNPERESYTSTQKKPPELTRSLRHDSGHNNVLPESMNKRGGCAKGDHDRWKKKHI